MTDTESNGTGGRDADGRFASGNRFGRGNPYASRVHELRKAFLDAVTPDDVRQVVAALTREALDGNVAAARELLQRALGPPEAADLLARVEELEVLLERMDASERVLRDR